MKYNTLDSYEFAGKRVLLRIDINSEIKNKKPIISERIIESAKTIEELQLKKAKVVVLAHQGRPGQDDFTSLKEHAKLLNKFVDIKFISDIMGKTALDAINNLKEGEAILLENTRYLNDELNPGKDNAFVNTLAPLFDYYVNDAFSVCHRVQSSITEFPKRIKSCVGRLMERELSNLEKLNLDDCLFILGGAKPEDVSLLLNKKKVIATGVLANLCLIAKGFSLGFDDSLKEKYPELLNEIRKNLNHISVPFDLAIGNKNKKKINRKEINLSELPVNSKIMDIGSGTISKIKYEIMNSKSVFMKGTSGIAELDEFGKGTKEILNSMSESKAFTVISGGNTSAAMDKFKIKNIKFVSLSGGALVYYLAGRSLPGLEALNSSK